MAFKMLWALGGAAKALSQKIDEEEKMAQLAMAGRIKEASQITKMRKQEINSMKEGLVKQDEEMVSYGLNDETARKAFLTSPTAWEQFKSGIASGKYSVNDYDKYVEMNTSSLGTMMPREYIDEILAKSALKSDVKPTFEGVGGWLAPSASRQANMFAALAGQAGMTPEQVAAAEAAPTELYRPEPAVSFKEGAFKKEKSVDERIASAESNLYDAIQQYGADSAQADAANLELSSIKAFKSIVDPEKETWANMMSKIKIAEFRETDPRKKEALRNERMRMQEIEKGKQEGDEDSKIPSEVSLSKLFSSAAANAIESKYGNRVGKDLAFITDPVTGLSSIRYTGNSQDLRTEIENYGKVAIAQVAAPYMDDAGVPLKRSVKVALLANRIGFTSAGVPIYPSVMNLNPKPKTQQQDAGGTPSPKTQAEYDALPSGTVYIHTDGTTKKKK